jgi:hypothetical protein
MVIALEGHFGYAAEAMKVAADGPLEAVLGKTRHTEFQRGWSKRREWSDGHFAMALERAETDGSH